MYNSPQIVIRQMAAMNGGVARHTACRYCRDHKVRCDGGQPSCEKCLRAGAQCVYVPTHRQTRADLTQTVEALQKRLYEAEARISGMVDQENGLSGIAPRSQVSCDTNWNNNTETQGLTAFSSPLPSTTQLCNADLAGPINSDFLGFLSANTSPHTTPAERNDLARLRRERELRSHPVSDINLSTELTFPLIFQTENYNNPGQGQSYVDIAALVTRGSSDGGMAASSSDRQEGIATPLAVTGRPGPPENNNTNISEGIATQVAEFSAAVFHVQAEIAGMASAVAEYVAWMRKVPAGVAPPNTNLVYTNVLEAIEERLREMGQMAQTKPRVAFRDMVTGLQKLGPAGTPIYSSLGSLEEKFIKESADIADFFSKRYNACALLSEQAQNIPHAQARRSESRQSSGSDQ